LAQDEKPGARCGDAGGGGRLGQAAMMATSPTRTINPLHFEDLDPRRFEDLVLQLVYKARQWEDIHHDGRLGSDDGVDIRAIERTMDGVLRFWFVQCKRYKTLRPADAKAAVDAALSKISQPPEVLLLVVGCDVTVGTRTAYEEYATQRGIPTAMLWTASKLEAMLTHDYPDLLFGFFGISLARRERSRETDLKRGLAMKRKLMNLFPYKCGHPKFIVRSIDDSTYPDTAEPPKGEMSSWFRPEFGRHYYNGIEAILSVNTLIVDKEDHRWAVIDYFDSDVSVGEETSAIDPDRYEIVNAYAIGRIPFRNIVEVDEGGDEYYHDVHLFCRYADASQPYEVIIYRVVDGHEEFWPEKRFDFSKRVRPRRSS
jgi:Restriction endonuclease